MSTFDEQQMVCPQFPEGEVRAILREHYGIAAAALKPLGSFQDQNFAVTSSDGQQFVLKIANHAVLILPLHRDLDGWREDAKADHHLPSLPSEAT